MSSTRPLRLLPLITGESKAKRPVRAQVYERTGKGKGTFDFRFRAPNGAIIGGSQGQGYTSRRDAHRALKSFLMYMAAPVVIEDT